MSIELLGADDFARLEKFDAPLASAGSYVASIVSKGPSSFLDNAKVRMEALLIDGKLVPLVISEKIEGNSNVCSAYAHHYSYPCHEFEKRFGRLRFALIKGPIAMLGGLLRAGRIDRIVFANNWLLTTNPRHRLSAAQIAALTEFLIRRYPDSAIVFRSVNRRCDPGGFDALRANRYRLIPSRRVYLVDTSSERYLQRRDFRVDLGKLKATDYSVLDGSSDLTPYASQIAKLFRELYIGKHSPLNPQYNTEFFSLILKANFMTHRAFVRDGSVGAYVSYFVEDNVMTGSVIGYDLALPRKLGLYRMGFALLIAEAARHKMLLNLSAGAGYFKMLRGAVPVQEYEAVYDRHLPMDRRLAWTALSAAAKIGSLMPAPRG